MKKIIDRKQYDTETATKLADDRYWDGNNWERSGRNEFLYRTPNPDKPEPNRKAKRESCSTGRDPKVPYTSQRLENEVSIKLPQEEVATFPQKYFSTRDINLTLRI